MEHRQKKILFLTENHSWGGSELLWSKTINSLINEEYTIGVCLFPSFEIPAWLAALIHDHKVEFFLVDSTILPWVKRATNRILPFRKRFKLPNQRKNFIREFQPDLIVLNQGLNFNAVEMMRFAAEEGFPYVTISHAVNEQLWPGETLREKMVSGFQSSLRNYFVSRDNVEITKSQMGVALNNFELVRNPFNVPFNETIDFPKGKPFSLACVGRYEISAKGQDVLLRVLAQKKWKERELLVNFYGSGQDEENIRDLVRFLDLKKVRLWSHTSPEEIWRNNHGLILTSRYEGLPIVIVEAMLCQRFAVVTDVSGNAELLEDNKTGFIAAAPRMKYIDEALERAWERRNDWQDIGLAAQKVIKKSIPEKPEAVFAQKLVDLLEKNSRCT